MSSYCFFLGGHDAEMLEIRTMLTESGVQFYDKGLLWNNALLSAPALPEMKIRDRIY